MFYPLILVVNCTVERLIKMEVAGCSDMCEIVSVDTLRILGFHSTLFLATSR